jgi:hypothetical protein
MSALVEQGFPGATLWVALMLMLYVRLRSNKAIADGRGDRAAAWLNAGIAGMFAVVVVAGMFSPQARTEVYVWIIALTCAFRGLALADARADSRLRKAHPPKWGRRRSQAESQL